MYLFGSNNSKLYLFCTRIKLTYKRINSKLFFDIIILELILIINKN